MGAEPKDREDFLAHIDWLHHYLTTKPAPTYRLQSTRQRPGRGKQVFAALRELSPPASAPAPSCRWPKIGTDRERMDTWNAKAAAEANQVVDDMGIERKGLVEEPLTGYVAQYLDGIWLRAPICTTDQCRPCTTCCCHRRNGRNASTVATTSTIRSRSVT